MSRILNICFKDGIYDTFDENISRFFKVSDNLNISRGDLVLVEPNYSKDICLNLGLVLEVTEVDDSDVDSIKYTTIGSRNDKNIIIPFFISVINLDVYKEQRDKIAKKKVIERKLDEATKKLEKVSKYKALADLNPEFKGLYDEYISIITEDTKLLN